MKFLFFCVSIFCSSCSHFNHVERYPSSEKMTSVASQRDWKSFTCKINFQAEDENTKNHLFTFSEELTPPVNLQNGKGVLNYKGKYLNLIVRIDQLNEQIEFSAIKDFRITKNPIKQKNSDQSFYTLAYYEDPNGVFRDHVLSSIQIVCNNTTKIKPIEKDEITNIDFTNNDYVEITTKDKQGKEKKIRQKSRDLKIKNLSGTQDVSF
jgi:hypothetical protein